MSIIEYNTKGPDGYNPTTGWLARVGNCEKVQGAVVGIGSSCAMRAQVMDCSGNVVTVKTFNDSGTPNAVSTVLNTVDFVIFASGI